MDRRNFFKCLVGASLVPALAPLVKPSPFKIFDQLGLRTKLFPVQLFILKLAYGVPLNPSEDAYLKKLLDEGRCTLPDCDPRMLVLVGGRRMGKTTLGSAFTLCETTRLMSLPQLGSGRHLVGTLSTCREMAGMLMDTTREQALASNLKEHLVQETLTSLRFRGNASEVDVKFRTSRAKTFRGLCTSSVVLDEIGLETCEETFDEILATVLPSTIPDGRVLVLNSPGALPEFERFFERAKKYAITLRIPTREGNPLIPAKFYRDQFVRGCTGYEV